VGYYHYVFSEDRNVDFGDLEEHGVSELDTDDAAAARSTVKEKEKEHEHDDRSSTFSGAHKQ